MCSGSDRPHRCRTRDAPAVWYSSVWRALRLGAFIALGRPGWRVHDPLKWSVPSYWESEPYLVANTTERSELGVDAASRQMTLSTCDHCDYEAESHSTSVRPHPDPHAMRHDHESAVSKPTHSTPEHSYLSCLFTFLRSSAACRSRLYSGLST